MTAAIVMQRTTQYVRENFLYAKPNFVLEPSAPMIRSGVIDSMGVMELIAFLESEFGISVEDKEMTEANLGSLNAIASYVMGKLEETAVPQVA